MKYLISVRLIVIFTPSDFAKPAGLSDIASPSSVEATAAPARAVETAPEPGTNRPPARAGVARRLALKRYAPPPITSCRTFIGAGIYIARANGCVQSSPRKRVAGP